MKVLYRAVCLAVFWAGVLFVLGNVQTVEAKKYYSLSNIGLSGCTTDNVDYAILSIRGNTVKYREYRIVPNGYVWEGVGGIKTAKLTSRTKYYVGDKKKVPDSLRKDKESEQNHKKDNQNPNSRETISRNKRIRITKKNINTEKWVYQTNKRTVRKNLSGRNNEIRIKKGKVTKIAVRLSY